MVAAKNYRHGMRRIPEYTIWLAMRARCNDPKHKGFKDYGERGIKVCSEWDSFDAFYLHVGPRPTPEHSIDRIDNNRGYEPGNCRWATSKQQASNRRPRKAANAIR